MRHLLLAAMVVAVCSPVLAQQWEVKKAPIMTRWAKDVSPDKAHPEYPRPQFVRKEWLNLNGLWDYAIAEKAAAQPTNWEGKILVPFPIESALSGVMKRVTPQQRLWHRRTFEKPAGWGSQRVLLNFGAVDWECTVFVNGKEVGSHRGGYSPFSFDITDALKAGGAQEIVVSVFDPTSVGHQPIGKQIVNPHGIWYTPTTGIWQTAWIEPVSPAHVKSIKITPDLDQKALKLGIDLAGAGDNVVDIEVIDSQKVVAQATAKLTGAGTVQATIAIADPKLWTPDTPFLYDLKLTLKNNNATADTVGSYFGMRKVSMAPDDKGILRLMLNNKPIFHLGPLDQGFWPDGLYTAPTDEALRYDIEMTRKWGFNMARKHVKVEPARWYYWADKLGLLVWQDMPSGEIHTPAPTRRKSKESTENFEKEWKDIMDAFHNYPSIVMWVVFNEGWGQYDTERLTNWTMQYDPSRTVNNASGWTDFPVGHVKDAHVYPGPGMPKLEEKRAIVLGEFGGLGLPLESHTWQEKGNWGYRSFQDPVALTDAYVNLIRRLHPLIGKGLCAAVYTQTTDVEIEVNGIMTYDRAIVKIDEKRMAEAHKKLGGPAPELKTLVPTSQPEGIEWSYTTEKPADNWNKADFDASGWKKGPGGFGTKTTPNTSVRTEWNGKDIWIRREVELKEVPKGMLELNMYHDEDAEVYINGVLAAKATGHVTDYVTVPIRAEALKALKAGKNVIAVHCLQTRGGQYIDLGLVELIEKP